MKDIQANLDEVESDLLDMLRMVKQAKKQFKKGQWRYEISLISHWYREGERSSMLRGEPGDSLSDLLERARKEFMLINRRSDVQASESVKVVFDNGYSLPLL